MRRLLVIIAALAALTISSGAMASTASAANCAFGVSQVYYTGNWEWYATADHCTNVNAVDFKPASTATAYLVDINPGTVHFSFAGGGTAYSQFYPVAGAGQYYSKYYNGVWGGGCGAPAFPIYKVYQVRIHNTANGGSWGNWVNQMGGQQAIC